MFIMNDQQNFIIVELGAWICAYFWDFDANMDDKYHQSLIEMFFHM